MLVYGVTFKQTERKDVILGGIPLITGCSFDAGRNNKQPTNSFNKQIPIRISHEAEDPQLECSEASCLVLDVAASAGSTGPAVLQTCRVSIERAKCSSTVCPPKK